MSKFPGIGETIQTGRWAWKEEVGGLEFISNCPNADRQGKRGKKHGFDAKGRIDRVPSSRGGGHGRSRNMPRAANYKNQQSKKDQANHTYVLLEDIKCVALDMLSEVEPVSESFNGLFKAQQFDYFLLHLLSYFKCFFEKMVQENKKNPMYIEPSPAEKKAYADAVQKLEVAQKLLGRSYCILVLGLGLEKQHHMECGMSRVSATQKDRGIFETFYSFCTFVVWITFRRKEFEVIKKEISRMLRSNTFNPATRVKYSAEAELKSAEQKEKKVEKVEDQKDMTHARKLLPAEYRRLFPKRPPIKSIIYQRSPTIVSLLPSPKEEALWLFDRSIHLTPEFLEKVGIKDEEGEEEHCKNLIIDVKKFKVGILGELYSSFNPMTLTPIGAENEDEEHEDGEETINKEEAGQPDKSQSSDHNLSRQLTVVSHATTDVGTEDEE